MVKITVVDAVYFDKEQLTKLKSMGEIVIFNDAPKTGSEIISRIGTSDVIITCWAEITKDAIDKAKNLKMIAVWATGYDHVDIKAAKEKGIIVTNVPNYSKESAAEHTFALILSIIRNIPQADKIVKTGLWGRENLRGIELQGKTIGIIGTGNIGSRVVKIANCFGMKVIAFTKNPSDKRAEKLNVKYVDLNELLQKSDIITIHVPLNDETEKILGEKQFLIIKRGALLINTSRGRIIDEKALIKALRDGRIAAAGLDVLEKEPPDMDNQLLKMDNVLLTPHCASYTDEALKRCTDICIKNIEKFVKGKPLNVINPKA